MLDNRINKIHDGNEETNKNLNKLMSILKIQDQEVLNTTDSESESSDESIDELQVDISKTSGKSPLKDSPKAKVPTSDLSVQAEMKPPAFPFG